MSIWICLRPGSALRPGTWLSGEEGELLFPVRIVRTDKTDIKFERTSNIGIPFEVLSSYIAPYGFRVSKDFTIRKPPLGAEIQQEIHDFQEYTEDIFEPDNLERNIEKNPSLTPKGGSGIVVPKEFKGNEEGSEKDD